MTPMSRTGPRHREIAVNLQDILARLDAMIDANIGRQAQVHDPASPGPLVLLAHDGDDLRDLRSEIRAALADAVKG
jgi:hypothetical protein